MTLFFEFDFLEVLLFLSDFGGIVISTLESLTLSILIDYRTGAFLDEDTKVSANDMSTVSSSSQIDLTSSRMSPILRLILSLFTGLICSLDLIITFSITTSSTVSSTFIGSSTTSKKVFSSFYSLLMILSVSA